MRKMYYPYFRGKQFDLLALSTLVKEQRWSKKIIPIIEPVRDSATLKKTIELFQKEKLQLYIIENPQVGRFKFFEAKQHPWQLKADTSIYSAEIITNQKLDQTSLAIFNEQSTRDQNLLNSNQFALLPNQGRFRILPFQKKIILDDAFIARKKIETYGNHDDDFFSDQHLYYQTDGFAGFSDYTIESSRYFDKGGPSRAIAIHVTYFDAYLNLRVKHFVSDTNDSTKDQALKFFEAAEKMLEWYDRNQDQLLLTLGMTELINYLKTKKFPGLGTIKKWSLAHHLELLGAYLNEGNHYLKGWKKYGIQG
ncbi:sce7725 family protein [Enterococcus alishanensis]